MATFYCRECGISYFAQTHECEALISLREMILSFNWECETCGETFDKRKTSPLQHICPVASENAKFYPAFTQFLNTVQGKFAVYYARHLIDASSRSNNTLA